MKIIGRFFMCFFTVILCVSLYAEDKFKTNEDEFFSNPDTIVEKKPENTELDKTEGKKTVGVSGELLSVFPYTMSRDYISDKDSGNNKFDPYMFGNMSFDARLPHNYKGFANGDLLYYPETSKTNAYLRELFVDFNIENAVYFRAGKQVLKWGRCYLWNPTDVINIQKTSFLDQITSREGTYGLKMSIPFGTSVNMYGFADMYHTDKIDDVGGAYKLEFLIGNTEMALSVWGKKKYHSVAGYDFSTRILGWDLQGEATSSYGSNSKKIRVVNGTVETYRENNKWIPKASIHLGRDFDGRDLPKRYSLQLEFFYNGAGYSNNILEDTKPYFFNKPVTTESPEGTSTTYLGGPKSLYLIGSNLYEPNYLSRYYAAIFTSVNRLFISELTFNLNGIANITDSSFIISAGLAYQNINDFKAGLTVNSYLGKKNREYTIRNDAADIILTAGIIY